MTPITPIVPPLMPPPDPIAEGLQTLVAANEGSQGLLIAAAESTDDTRAQRLFRSVAVARGRHAEALRSYLAMNQGDAPTQWHLAASVHATWLTFRAGLNAGSAEVVYLEVERAEERMKAEYEAVIEQLGDAPVLDVLRHQQRVLAQQRDSIRTTRMERAA